jgi:hypothetical protein
MEDIIVVQDSVIQQQLEYQAEDIQLREEAIKAHQKTIEEYRREQGKIREAATQFGVFLKKFSMAPHNDATAAYVEHLIKEEKIKVQCGRQENIKTDATGRERKATHRAPDRARTTQATRGSIGTEHG